MRLRFQYTYAYYIRAYASNFDVANGNVSGRGIFTSYYIGHIAELFSRDMSFLKERRRLGGELNSIATKL